MKDGRFWVKGHGHPETFSVKKCYLYRTTHLQDILLLYRSLWARQGVKFVCFFGVGERSGQSSRGQTAVSFLRTYVESLTITRSDDGAVRGRGVPTFDEGPDGPLVVLFLRKSIAHHAALSVLETIPI